MATRSIPLVVTTISVLKAQNCYYSSHGDPAHVQGVVPLTIFDRIGYCKLVGSAFVFKPPMPADEDMKEGLSKALSCYPHFAGRIAKDLHGLPCFLINNAGIRLIEACSPMALEDVLPLDPCTVENMDDLFPPLHIVEGQELLHVQLNRFACGGLVIGLALDHRVADGHSASVFLKSWARLVRGLELEQLPYHDRASVTAPRNPLKCLFDHEQIEFKEVPVGPPSDVGQVVVHLSSDIVARLKAKVTEGVPSRKCSTFLCLLTHFWKTRTLVRGLHDTEETRVRVAVDGRHRLKPEVPKEYFGNLVLRAFPCLTAGELLRQSYAETAEVIRQAIAKTDDAYFRSFIDYGELMRSKGRVDLQIEVPRGDVICPDLEVLSWLTFDFHKLDFGRGILSSVLWPPGDVIDGDLFFLPSCSNEGDVDVFVGLMPHHIEPFLQIVLDV